MSAKSGQSHGVMMNHLFNNTRRWLASVALGAFIVPMVHAAEPAVNAQQLALAERAIKYCGSVDPKLSKPLADKVAEMIKGVSAGAVAKIRGSDDYKKAYALMDSFVAQVDERNAKVLCADS